MRTLTFTRVHTEFENASKLGSNCDCKLFEFKFVAVELEHFWYLQLLQLQPAA